MGDTSHTSRKEITVDNLKDELEKIWQNGGVGKESLEEALKEELDLHSAITWEKVLREGVDAHFNGRVEDVAGIRAVNASDYWTHPRLIVPIDLQTFVAYSKQAWKYGVLSVRTVLPDLSTYPNMTQTWLGFENGGSTGNGIAAFRYRISGGVETLYAYLSGLFGGTASSVDLTTFLPVDYKTAKHRYSIHLGKNMVAFFIDGNTVAYGLITPNSMFTAIAGPPYSLFSVSAPLPARMTSLGPEFWQPAGPLAAPFQWDLSPHEFRVSDGVACPPRVLRLYDAGTNTLFIGLAIAAGSETSHPFPIYDYQGKTLNFRASQQGTLSVEVLEETNNWREYDTMGMPQNKVKTYSIEGEAVLARVVYTPNTYPCTISEAEVVLR